MKKLVTMLLFSALTLSLYSQEYYPNLYEGTMPDGRKWCTVEDRKKTKDMNVGIMIDPIFEEGKNNIEKKFYPIKGGTLLIPCDFDYIKGKTYKNKQYFEASINKESRQHIKYQDCITFDSNGKVLFRSNIGFFSWRDDYPDEDYMEVFSSNGRCALIDKSMNFVIPFSAGYSEIHSYYYKDNKARGLVEVKKGDLKGFYDLINKREVVKPDSFDWIEYGYYNNQLLPFFFYRKNDVYGVINRQGKEIIPYTRGYTYISYNAKLKRFRYDMPGGYHGECDINGKELSRRLRSYRK